MRTIEGIKKSIEACELFIASHKKQIEFHTNDDFDIDKIIEFSNKIKLLEVEMDTLKWVLNEPV